MPGKSFGLTQPGIPGANLPTGSSSAFSLGAAAMPQTASFGFTKPLNQSTPLSSLTASLPSKTLVGATTAPSFSFAATASPGAQPSWGQGSAQDPHAGISLTGKQLATPSESTDKAAPQASVSQQERPTPTGSLGFSALGGASSQPGGASVPASFSFKSPGELHFKDFKLLCVSMYSPLFLSSNES